MRQISHAITQGREEKDTSDDHQQAKQAEELFLNLIAREVAMGISQ